MDLPEEDAVGNGQTPPDPARLVAAFEAIAAEGGNDIFVGTRAWRTVTTCRITMITGMLDRGVRRAQIERVWVSAALRGQGIGAAMMRDAESSARAAGSTRVHLATHASRNRARRFHASLGFTASPVGYKRTL